MHDVVVIVIIMFKFLFYSYLNASIGLSLAALRAGYQPKNIPIKEHTIKERIIDVEVTMV